MYNGGNKYLSSNDTLRTAVLNSVTANGQKLEDDVQPLLKKRVHYADILLKQKVSTYRLELDEQLATLNECAKRYLDLSRTLKRIETEVTDRLNKN